MALLLVGFAAANVGIPVAVPRIARSAADGAASYPCQAHQCGCRSAEQCWRGCCCFSRAEKLAWARKHGVTPPRYVAAAAKADLPGSNPVRGRACCRPAPKDHPAWHNESVARTSEPNTCGVLLILAQKCHGVLHFLTSLSHATPPEVFSASVDADLAAWGPPPPFGEPRGVCDAPPSPPPEV